MDAAARAEAASVVWRPQPGPQTALLACPVFEAFFGGARGGGKTDGVLGEWAVHADRYGAAAIGLMVRRTRVELAETFERARALFGPLGATFTAVPMRCVMPGGARLTFAYLERDADAEGYQGHSYTRVYVEEAGNFPSPAPIMKLFATLRSGAGVPCRIRLTGNPGGPGHQWVRARYIDPAPLGWQVIRDDRTGLERVYIPSRVTDNRHLGADYVSRLKAAGSPELVRAWLEGDWSVIAGAFFPEFDAGRHIIAPRALPEHWQRFRSLDWGSARPFSVGWWAVSDGTLPDIARGALVRYREWYGSTGEPNVGLRLTAEEVATGIKRREASDPGQVLGVADPAIFSSDGGPSIAERMGRAGVTFKPADNARVARMGALGGWDQVRQRLKGDAEGQPMMLIFATCVDAIRTLPALQHDGSRPEDVDTEGEDHAADEIRYACMSRPMMRDAPPVQKPLPPGVFRIADLRPERARADGRV
ncbi:MAG: terminase large subunit domain-containing protein [Pseudomonadota bacterium]